METQASREMPRYKCHKEVWALKIKSVVAVDLHEDSTPGVYEITPEEEGYGPFHVTADYVHKHNPEAGGYYVLYQDGYTSYSPAKAFEEGYARIN